MTPIFTGPRQMTGASGAESRNPIDMTDRVPVT